MTDQAKSEQSRLEEEIDILARWRIAIRTMPEGGAKGVEVREWDARFARLLATCPEARVLLKERLNKERLKITGNSGSQDKTWKPDFSKSIVFCADGTHNGFDVDADGLPTGTHPSNVLKLFRRLRGQELASRKRPRFEAERHYRDGAGILKQVAKYLHGVGDSENYLVKKLRGADGGGVIARMVRAYTFLSRHHHDGDRIVLVGFSRGAYTMCALAEWVAHQGLLQNKDGMLSKDRELAYRLGAASWAAWQRHRIERYRTQRDAAHVPFQLGLEFDILLSRLPSFFSRPAPGDPAPEFKDAGEIRSLAVWDTVGALGLRGRLRESGDGTVKRIDQVRLADETVHRKVKQALHAISADEDRLDFTPLLWEPREGVEQRLFPGVHADVGGGYRLAESGLSDCALAWMLRRLSEQDVVLLNGEPMPCGDPTAAGHREWQTGLLAMRPRCMRNFRDREDINFDLSLRQRIFGGLVQAHKDAALAPYSFDHLGPIRW